MVVLFSRVPPLNDARCYNKAASKNHHGISYAAKVTLALVTPFSINHSIKTRKHLYTSFRISIVFLNIVTTQNFVYQPVCLPDHIHKARGQTKQRTATILLHSNKLTGVTCLLYFRLMYAFCTFSFLNLLLPSSSYQETIPRHKFSVLTFSLYLDSLELFEVPNITVVSGIGYKQSCSLKTIVTPSLTTRTCHGNDLACRKTRNCAFSTRLILFW